MDGGTAMRAIRIGYEASPQDGSFAAMRESWIRAEAMGADAVYNDDHFFPVESDPDGLHFEAWTSLAALAEAPSRVEIGVLVTCMSYRNPNLLADMARTVDHISHGRLVLGIGSGWFEKDYTEFGYEFGTAITRLHAFRDAIPVIKERMAIGNPPPVRGKIPIMIGGGGEKVMLKLVAQHADIWHGFGTPDEYRHKCEVLDAHCVTVGRDPVEIERSVMFEAHELGDDAFFESYVDAGATYFFYSAAGPDYSLAGLQQLLDWRAQRSQSSR